MTENGGIHFSLHCKTSTDFLEMVPASKVESHLMMEEGQITCDLIGTCKLLCLLYLIFKKMTITFGFYRRDRVRKQFKTVQVQKNPLLD